MTAVVVFQRFAVQDLNVIHLDRKKKSHVKWLSNRRGGRIKEIINNWRIQNNEAQPTFYLKELMGIVLQIEDEETFLKVKSKFDSQQKLYHPEQLLLLNARLFGRYQYLRTENRLAGR